MSDIKPAIKEHRKIATVKTVGDLRFVLSGYEDTLKLQRTTILFINRKGKQPYKLEIQQ